MGFSLVGVGPFGLGLAAGLGAASGSCVAWGPGGSHYAVVELGASFRLVDAAPRLEGTA